MLRAVLFLSLLALVSASVFAVGPLDFSLHMSDCENRWIVMRHDPGDMSYRYGFVYVDPQAGFTLDIGGSFVIDEQGNYQKVHDPLNDDKLKMKIRLEEDGIAALLPREALTQLGLSDQPDWLQHYRDSSDPITHKVTWGRWYNHIGNSERALTYLEPAYKENPIAPRLEFELGYAYNALRRPSEAIAVLKPAFERDPKAMFLCKELAYAELISQQYRESIERHLACIPLCNKEQDAEKSELAMNVAHAYKVLGDKEDSEKWLANAKQWAPKGSAVYSFFHPGEK